MSKTLKIVLASILGIVTVGAIGFCVVASQLDDIDEDFDGYF